jgi:hypothetical protein
MVFYRNQSLIDRRGVLVTTTKHKITDVKGIGPSTAAVLAEHGIKSVRDLAAASVPRLIAIPGFSEFRAGQVKFNAQLLLKTLEAKEGAEDRSKPKAKAAMKKADSPSSEPPVKKDKHSEKPWKSKKDPKKSKKKEQKKDRSKDKSAKKDKKKK